MIKLYNNLNLPYNISTKTANNLFNYFSTKLYKINKLNKNKLKLKKSKTLIKNKLTINKPNKLKKNIFMYYKLKYLNILKNYLMKEEHKQNLFEVVELKFNYQDLLNKNLNYIKIQKKLKKKNKIKKKIFINT